MRKVFCAWFNNQDTADMMEGVIKDMVYAHNGVVWLADVECIESDVWALTIHMSIDIRTSCRISMLMEEVDNVIVYRSERVD